MSGTLLSWGRGRHGVLGQGHDNDVELPRRVSAVPPLRMMYALKVAHQGCAQQSPRLVLLYAACSNTRENLFHLNLLLVAPL